MADEYSIDTRQTRTFGIVDYILFALLICASAAIGFYHAVRDRKKKNTEDFHLGGRKMHTIPVSLSLSATYLSSLTILGTPAEMYIHDTMFWWIAVAMLLATAGAAFVFVPVFYNLNITSCFHYLELRFSKFVRTLASVFFLLQTLVYLGFVLYAPSLAFEAVTGVSLWGSMVGVAAVCTLYTTLGGMKTVLWTHILQLVIMIGGLLTLLIEGSKKTGGFSTAWQIAADNHRIHFTDFSFDPRARHSVWTVAIGGSFFWMYLYGVNQAQVQRACSLPTLRKAQVALWLNFPGLVLITSLCCMIGIVMYAFYSTCDPVSFGLVSRPTQMLPLFVMDVLGDLHGLPGVFMACVFSGVLSTTSAGLTAMSAALLEDFVKPFYNSNVVAKHDIKLAKLLVVAMGILVFGVAVLISEAPGLILQFSYSMYAIVAGPLFGLFISGMIFPWTNKWGAASGFVLAIGVMYWLGIATALAEFEEYSSPVSTDGCNWNTTAAQTTPTSTSTSVRFFTISGKSRPGDSTPQLPTEAAESGPLDEFYRMSYLWYTGLGMIITVVVALVVSFLTGHTKPSSIDTKLMCPIFDRLFPCLPEAVRKPLRFGVVYKQDEKYRTNSQAPEKEEDHDL